MVLSTAMGVLLGSTFTFLVLANLGHRFSRPPSSPTPVLIPLGTPPSTPAGTPQPSLPSPTTTVTPSSAGEVSLDSLGVRLRLPPPYRVASALNTFVNARPGAGPHATITKAASTQEEEYVAVLQTLYQKQAATEAPEFLPGQTITLGLVSDASEQAFAAQLAKSTMSVTTPQGLSGTRYVKVEGISTYDVTYLTLGEGFDAAHPEGKSLSVTMAYGVDAPQFDEDAYLAVVNSIRSL